MKLRIPPIPSPFFLGLGAILVLSTCGDDQGPITPGGSVPSTADVIVMSVDEGPESTHTEDSGLSSIDCDPRVDWGRPSIILWEDFTNGSGPSGYDF